MAEFELKAGEVCVPAVKLTASEVDTVKCAGYVPGIEVFSDGAAAVYFTLDGTNPTVGGHNCYELPALACTRTVRGSGNRTIPIQIKLISAGTPTVTITRSEDGNAHLIAL